MRVVCLLNHPWTELWSICVDNRGTYSFPLICSSFLVCSTIQLRLLQNSIFLHENENFEGSFSFQVKCKHLHYSAFNGLHDWWWTDGKIWLLLREPECWLIIERIWHRPNIQFLFTFFIPLVYLILNLPSESLFSLPLSASECRWPLP